MTHLSRSFIEKDFMRKDCASVLFEWKNNLTTHFLVRFLCRISLLERDSFHSVFLQKRLQHQLRTLGSQYTA